MLGERLSDPDHAEYGGVLDGMGLLPVCTTFTKEKIRKQTAGTFGTVSGILSGISGLSFEGYEIHMGRPESLEDTGKLTEITHMDDGTVKQDGYVSGSCMGTYVHGIFESGTFRNNLIQLLFDRRGLVWNGKKQMDYLSYKNRQYDMLADVVREHTDLKAIYHMIGLS